MRAARRAGHDIAPETLRARAPGDAALCHVLRKPSGQLLRIRDAALPKPKALADLRPVTLARAPRPLKRHDPRSLDLQLPSDELHHRHRHLPGDRETTVAGVVLQHQREAQPRRPVLRLYERALVLKHRPVLDKLIQIDGRLCSHGRIIDRRPGPAQTDNPQHATETTTPKWRQLTRFLPTPPLGIGAITGTPKSSG